MNSKSSVCELKSFSLQARELADDMSKLSTALGDLFMRSSLGIEFDDETRFLLLKFSGCSHVEDVSEETFARYQKALAQLQQTKSANERVREV